MNFRKSSLDIFSEFLNKNEFYNTYENFILSDQGEHFLESIENGSYSFTEFLENDWVDNSNIDFDYVSVKFIKEFVKKLRIH